MLYTILDGLQMIKSTSVFRHHLGLGLSTFGYRCVVISWNCLHHNNQVACVPNKQVHECTPEDVVESFKVTSTRLALTGQAGSNVPGLNEAR